MKFYLFIYFFILNYALAENTLRGKGLICNYGLEKEIYEAYLFYQKKYVSKYIFLEKDTYKIRENEKRNYKTSKNYIEIKPFIINRKNFNVIDTEFKRIVGSCKIIANHKNTIKFMHELRDKRQIDINKILGREEI